MHANQVAADRSRPGLLCSMDVPLIDRCRGGARVYGTCVAPSLHVYIQPSDHEQFMYFCPISGEWCCDPACGADGCSRADVSAYRVCLQCGNVHLAVGECRVCIARMPIHMRDPRGRHTQR